MIPLTRQLDGMQAWKIVIPTSKATPEPRAHDGYEWIYVLSGHMRLVLGDQDWVLGPGEVAEFDTDDAALVRQHRRRTGGDPQHLRTTRRTDEGTGPSPAGQQLTPEPFAPRRPK